MLPLDHDMDDDDELLEMSEEENNVPGIESSKQSNILLYNCCQVVH